MPQKKPYVQLHEEIPLITFTFVKWLILATIAGIVVGLSTEFFVWLLERTTQLTQLVDVNARIILLPIGILISTILVQKLAPQAQGHGTEKVIEAVHEKNAQIDVKVIPVKLLATVITLASGGSAGKEGPAAQIGAGMMSVLAKQLRFSCYDRTRLVICGVSAGFAAIFGTPVAGAVFGIEVLFIGQISYDALLPSVISGIVSWKVTSLLGVTHPMFYFDPSLSHIDPAAMVWIILAGLFFGFVSLSNILIMETFELIFKKLKIHYIFKALIGSGALIALSMLLGNQYLGLGTDIIDNALSSPANTVMSVALLAFLAKALFTSITLACGGSGGVVTPIFFIGVTSGITYATLFNLPVQLYAGLGMVSLLAGCANAPISAILMGLELFGAPAAPLVAICCITSFLMTGHHSIYPSQRLARSKTSLIECGTGSSRIDKLHDKRTLEKSSLIKILIRQYKRRHPELDITNKESTSSVTVESTNQKNTDTPVDKTPKSDTQVTSS